MSATNNCIATNEPLAVNRKSLGKEGKHTDAVLRQIEPATLSSTRSMANRYDIIRIIS